MRRLGPRDGVQHLTAVIDRHIFWSIYKLTPLFTPQAQHSKCGGL